MTEMCRLRDRYAQERARRRVVRTARATRRLSLRRLAVAHVQLDERGADRGDLALDVLGIDATDRRSPEGRQRAVEKLSIRKPRPFRRSMKR
jgi:hypothetical protein